MADIQTLNINGTAYDIFARGLYGYSYSVTVDGDKDTYYPVVISTTISKRTPNIITISKDLGSKTASYPGNHDGGTASCLYRYEVRNQYWDGNGGYCKCLHAWYGYAQLVAEATMLGSAVGNFCIWLRGGGTLYNIYTTFASSATPYYSKTNVGSSTYPVYVEPRTTIGNAGQYSNTLLGYGSISGTATYASRLGDSSSYYTKASLDAALNGKSNTGHTHTKSQITDFPTIPTNTNQLTNGAGFITGITKSMVTNALGYTPPTSDTNTWRPITDSYSGTASDTSLSQKGGKAIYDALVNGYAGSAGYTTRLYANSTGDLITAPGDYSLSYSRFQLDASNIFPASNNANGCITAHLHSGNYYAQIGLSSNGRMYYRTMMSQALNSGVSWNTIAFTSDIPTIPTSLPANGGTATYASRLGDSSSYHTKTSLDNTISSKLDAKRMSNPSNGTSWTGAIPFILSLKSAGAPVYDDPEFKNGTNSCLVYNNSGNGNVTITRISDDQNSANSSGYILKIYNNGGTTSPGLGGFYQGISSRAGAVFCQIFRAKIPVGYTVLNAENNMGDNYTTYWLTDRSGTGKWEWYCRITICGVSGTMSGGGHVYLSGTGPVTWYMSYCNLIDLSKGDYDGLKVKYADSAGSAVDQTARNAASAAQTTANSKWTYNADTIKGVKVNNAGTADNAGKLGGHSDTAYFAYRGWDNTPGKDANAAMSGVMGSNFSYANNCPYIGPLLTFNCGGYNLQLNGAYTSNSGKNLAFRLRNGDNGTNYDWYTFIHSGNISSYALTSLPSHTHDYLPLAGGTLTGLLTTTSGNSHNGIKIGSNYINAISGDLIFQNNGAIRFGGDSWDYNVWAGLKYVHSSKSIYLGLADGSQFTANSAQSGGKMYFPGISGLYATAYYQSSDERLKTFYDPIKVDLEKLKKLRKNYFKFNDKDKLEIGVSAQEIQNLYPELVSSDDNGYLSVAYDKLSVIALVALDEQQNIIKDQNNKINQLEARLKAIENILNEKGIL